jgi:hypothetical protein
MTAITTTVKESRGFTTPIVDLKVMRGMVLDSRHFIAPPPKQLHLDRLDLEDMRVGGLFDDDGFGRE